MTNERLAALRQWGPKILITGALIGFVGWRLDLRSLGSHLLALDPFWTALAFGAVFLAIVISAWKWGLILSERGYPLPFSRLFRHYFVGLFFNNVLPTTVGGDAVRAWETTKDTGETPEAVGSVITERLIAGVALGFTALLGLPFVTVSPHLAGLVLAFLAIDLGLVLLFLVPRIAEGMVTKLLPLRFGKIRESARATVVVVRATIKNRPLFAKVAALSVLFQVFVALVNFCIFEALGVHIGLAQCVVYTPMIFTVTMLPVSVSGFGVREAAYWYFFAQAGVSEVDAVGASLAFFVIVGLASLPGAPLFALNRRKPPVQTLESAATSA